MKQEIKQRIRKGGIVLLFSAVAVLLTTLVTKPKVTDLSSETVTISSETVTISVPYVIAFPNFAEIIVDPDTESCSIRYDHKAVGAKRMPCAVATVSFAETEFVLTDIEALNNEISINGRIHSLRASTPVLHAARGLLWTTEKIKQGPRLGPRAYPLQGSLPATH